MHGDLVVSRDGVQERLHTMPCRSVHNWIYAGQRETVFWTGVVEVRVINTYSLFVPLLWNNHHVGHPFGVFNCSNESIIQKIIDLGLDDQVAVWVEASHFFLTGLADGAMFSMCEACVGADSGHICMSLSEYISI